MFRYSAEPMESHIRCLFHLNFNSGKCVLQKHHNLSTVCGVTTNYLEQTNNQGSKPPPCVQDLMQHSDKGLDCSALSLVDI